MSSARGQLLCRSSPGSEPSRHHLPTYQCVGLLDRTLQKTSLEIQPSGCPSRVLSVQRAYRRRETTVNSSQAVYTNPPEAPKLIAGNSGEDLTYPTVARNVAVSRQNQAHSPLLSLHLKVRV
jgi:hypothetical protein